MISSSCACCLLRSVRQVGQQASLNPWTTAVISQKKKGRKAPLKIIVDPWRNPGLLQEVPTTAHRLRANGWHTLSSKYQQAWGLSGVPGDLETTTLSCDRSEETAIPMPLDQHGWGLEFPVDPPRKWQVPEIPMRVDVGDGLGVRLTTPAPRRGSSPLHRVALPHQHKYCTPMKKGAQGPLRCGVTRIRMHRAIRRCPEDQTRRSCNARGP